MKTLNMKKIVRTACLVTLTVFSFVQEASAQKHCYCRTKETGNVWMSMAVPNCGAANKDSCIRNCVNNGHKFADCY